MDCQFFQIVIFVQEYISKRRNNNKVWSTLLVFWIYFLEKLSRYIRKYKILSSVNLCWWKSKLTVMFFKFFVFKSLYIPIGHNFLISLSFRKTISHVGIPNNSFIEGLYQVLVGVKNLSCDSRIHVVIAAYNKNMTEG